MPPSARFAGSHRPSFRRLGKAEESTDDARSDSAASSGSGVDDDGPEGKSVVRGPSGKYYNIGHLSKESQDLVRETYSQPPKMTPECCRQIDEDTIAFQCTEHVPRTFRVRRQGTECSQCGIKLCAHVIAFFDTLTNATLYSHQENDRNHPLTLTPAGFPEEIGDPFKRISRFDLGLLADSLHCDVINSMPDGQDEGVNPNHSQDEGGGSSNPSAGKRDAINPSRWRDAREMLGAAQYYAPEQRAMSMAEYVDRYRSDVFDQPRLGRKRIRRGDLDCTVARMLAENKEFFHYFKAQMRSADPINDVFRKLGQRIKSVMAQLDGHATKCKEDASFASQAASAMAGTHHDVAWAADHIIGVVNNIHAILWSKVRDQPLSYEERRSAARTLLRILFSVVEKNMDLHPAPSRRDRNLCVRLIAADPDSLFILQDLDALADVLAEKDHVNFLQHIKSRLLGGDVVLDAYIERVNRLLARVNTTRESSVSSSATGSKRPAQEGGRGPKRLK